MKKEKFVISGEIIDKNIKELTLRKGTKIDIMTKKEMIFPNIFKLLNEYFYINFNNINNNQMYESSLELPAFIKLPKDYTITLTAQNDISTDSFHRINIILQDLLKLWDIEIHTNNNIEKTLKSDNNISEAINDITEIDINKDSYYIDKNNKSFNIKLENGKPLNLKDIKFLNIKNILPNKSLKLESYFFNKNGGSGVVITNGIKLEKLEKPINFSIQLINNPSKNGGLLGGLLGGLNNNPSKN